MHRVDGELDPWRRGRTKHDDIVSGDLSTRDNARGQIVGDRDGMIKLVFDARRDD